MAFGENYKVTNCLYKNDYSLHKISRKTLNFKKSQYLWECAGKSWGEII